MGVTVRPMAFVTRAFVALTGASMVLGCAPHAAGLPPGPPPEYEAADPSCRRWDAEERPRTGKSPAPDAGPDHVAKMVMNLQAVSRRGSRLDSRNTQ